MTQKFTIHDAIVHLVNVRRLTKYKIAKELKVAPISLDNYLNGKGIRSTTAEKFKDVFNIEITDAIEPGRINETKDLPDNSS